MIWDANVINSLLALDTFWYLSVCNPKLMLVLCKRTFYPSFRVFHSIYTIGQFWLFLLCALQYRIAGYFRNRNFRTSSQIWIFENLNLEKFIFRSPSGFRIIEKSVSQITRPCLPRTHLLGMAYDRILTVVGWQSLISGNPVVTLTTTKKTALRWTRLKPRWLKHS